MNAPAAPEGVPVMFIGADKGALSSDQPFASYMPQKRQVMLGIGGGYFITLDVRRARQLSGCLAQALAVANGAHPSQQGDL